MEPDASPASLDQPVPKAHLSHVYGVLIVVVSPGKGTFLSIVVVGRIPHLCDGILYIADSPVNLVFVIFPKSLVRLPSHLASRRELGVVDGFPEILREI